MELLDHEPEPIDLTVTPLHLGLGSRARPISGFAFDPNVLSAYAVAVAEDGRDGRLLIMIDEDGRGDHWERHPAGDEVIICVDGTVVVTREIGDTEEQVVLGPGLATINPAGTWHTVDARGTSRILTITPGLGTQHRDR